jgi:DNA-directed RNA polymerase subunit RPC12/RpoP
MDYKKPDWNKGRVCSKCGHRFYATTNQGHSICPSCLYKKMKEKNNGK